MAACAWMLLLSAGYPEHASKSLAVQDPPVFKDSHECNMSPSDFVVRGVTAVDDREAPHCTFALLLKTGSSSLRKMFLDGVTANGEVVCERGGLGPWNWNRGDVVIGQVRNPYSWYASLWSYNSDAFEQGKTWAKKLKLLNLTAHLSQETPRGSTEADRKRFHKWVRQVSLPSMGLLSMHMWVNYVHTSSKPIFASSVTDTVSLFFKEQSMRLTPSTITNQSVSADLDAWDPLHETDLPEHVACWIQAEDSEPGMRKCLQRCMDDAHVRTAVDWGAFNTSLDDHRHSNPSTTRVSDAELYDTGTATFVAKADARLFRAFGYGYLVK